jgi:response regulator RpfG family c-di-GMP phosphodiesterase
MVQYLLSLSTRGRGVNKDIPVILEQTKDLNLLYVEDDKDTRESTLMLLSELFNNVVVAVDGEDGCKKFENNDIDLIISDINMPTMNGIEMSKHIKNISEDIPIIIISAITDISAMKEAIDIGIDCFISKPIIGIELLYDKIFVICEKINYDKNLINIKKAKESQEKVEFIFNLIKNISHHWRQPLSIISTVASSILLKKELDMKIEDKDFENLEQVIIQTTELSEILHKFEILDFDNINIEDLKSMIHISNPISKDS